MESVNKHCKRTFKALLMAGLLAVSSSQSLASYIVLDEFEEYGDTRWGAVPYAFSTETLGTGIGVGAFVSGVHQPQSSLVGTAFKTSNDSWLVAAALTNFRFGDRDRWFFDLYLSISHYTDQRFYNSSNDSEEDEFIAGISNDRHFEASFLYALPIGAAKDDPLTVYRTRKGMRLTPPQGGEIWNPLASGKTLFGGRYFYRYRDLDLQKQEIGLLSASTNGMEIWLDYDNTDFLPNATFGSRQKLTFTRDFGWFDSSNSWTNLSLDASKYFNLGASSWFRQQVLALDFWTSHTFDWDLDEKTGRIEHRPPPGFGSELGGYDRLRAYPTSRFQDKSAVYYGAELRLTPKINGLDTLPLVKHLEIDWWQVVGFAEAGRVAPNYNTELFTKDLKWDVGLSFRVMAFRIPLRLDYAVSEDTYSIWAMYSQPFAR